MPKNVDKKIQYFKYSTLKTLLKKKGWTAQKLSVESGLSSGLISNLLSGKRQPRIDSTVLLAKALKVPINYLIEDPCPGENINIPLHFQELINSTKKIIQDEIKKYCQNCDKLNSEEMEYHEHYELLSEEDLKVLREFRRQRGIEPDDNQKTAKEKTS